MTMATATSHPSRPSPPPVPVRLHLDPTVLLNQHVPFSGPEHTLTAEQVQWYEDHLPTPDPELRERMDTVAKLRVRRAALLKTRVPVLPTTPEILETGGDTGDTGRRPPSPTNPWGCVWDDTLTPPPFPLAVFDPSEFAWMEESSSTSEPIAPNPCAEALLERLETHPVSSDAAAAFHATRVRIVTVTAETEAVPPPPVPPVPRSVTHE